VAAAGNAVLLAASFSLTGHAAEATPRLLAEAADGIHLAAAGIWLGGLTVLLLAYLPEAAEGPDADDVPDVLARWSRVAMAAVGMLVVTGTYQAWRETRALDALTGTTYGRLLLGKLAVVVTLLVVAAAARTLVTRSVRVPALSGAPADSSSIGASGSTGASPGGSGASALRRLRGAVGVEAILGVAVLVVTSFLVATPPARTSYGPPFSASVEGRDAEGTPIKVVLDIDPTKVGLQTVRLHAFSPTGEVLPFASASGELRPEGDAGPVSLTFTPVADGEGVATGVVPSAGRWKLTVQILTSATTDYAATTAYTVR
jgi:copper transport protein